MMFLLDTNILLELLLDQPYADEVQQFLTHVPARRLHLSDFSLHSTGVRLFARKLFHVFNGVVSDLIVKGGMRIVGLEVENLPLVAEVARQYRLDFDDAYQYVVASVNGLALVSFDSDLDNTPRGRKTPAQVLAEHRQ